MSEKKIYKGVDKIIPIRRYDEQARCFICEDKTAFDYLEILSKDQVNRKEGEFEYDNLRLWKFLQLYRGDIKLISLNFPLNTQLQRDNLKTILEQAKDPVRRKWLERRLDELEELEVKVQRKEYFLCMFARSSSDLEKERDKALAYIGRGADKIIREISFEKKRHILKRLCNMNSNVKEDE